MKLLLYETVTAGDLPGSGRCSSSILCEGYAMAGSFAEDLRSAGHQITMVAGKKDALPSTWFGDSTVEFVRTDGQPRDALRRALRHCDAAYVIAPESGGMLAELTGIVEELRGSQSSLNVPSATIRRVSHKPVVYASLAAAGVNVPRTLVLKDMTVQEALHACSTLGLPLVLKPADGTGSEGLSVAFSEDDLHETLGGSLRSRLGGRLIAQDYVAGVPASVSMLCSHDSRIALSLNRQIVHLTRRPDRSLYVGGVVPLDHPAREDALTMACRAAQSLDLARGYVGIDLVLSPKGPVVVDVNPRLTTSYVGLRRVSQINVADCVLRCCLDGRMPRRLRQQGYSLFLKTSLRERPARYALVEAYGSTLGEAVMRFRAMRSSMLGTCFGSGGLCA